MTHVVQRIFKQEDQIWFAEMSGDWNPIHVDPESARRTLMGEQVVHGMHGLIWALDHLWREEPSLSFDRFSVSFHRPILLDRPIDLEIFAEEGRRRLLIKDGEDVLCSIICTPGDVSTMKTITLSDVNAPTAPAVRLFDDLKEAKGFLDIGATGGDVAVRYKAAANVLGGGRVATLATLSRLVGMECPGLHSLFSALEIRVTDNEDATLSYSVIRHRSMQQPIKMSVSGGGLEGVTSAFFRPPPSEQPSFRDVQASVSADASRGQVALVVGGSRGLGEMTAKVIAAGGGTPVLTYYKGKVDAERIAAEIQDSGAMCRIVPLDITAAADDWALLTNADQEFTQLYYFATPHIGRQTATLFDSKMLEQFQAYYVDGFARLCLALAKERPLKVFYPSTCFLDDAPREMAEYVAAKAAGETMAAHLDLHVPNLDVITRRLPRLDTDQNLAVLGKRLEPLLEHVLSFVEEMQEL